MHKSSPLITAGKLTKLAPMMSRIKKCIETIKLRPRNFVLLNVYLVPQVLKT